MRLKEYQKELIKLIIERKVFDLSSFIINEFNIEEYKMDENDPYQFNVITRYDKLEIKNIENALDKLIDYFSLLDLLKANNLIYYKEEESKYEINITSGYEGEKTKLYRYLINKLLQRNQFFIYSTPQLNEFYKNFNTYDEIKNINIENHRNMEKKDREKSLFWTRILVIIAIISSTATSIISIYYNHYQLLQLEKRVTVITNDTINYSKMDTSKK